MPKDRAIAPNEDPVCGMTVDREVARAKGLVLTHDGTEFAFCGKGCLLEFRDDPERFLDPAYTPRDVAAWLRQQLSSSRTSAVVLGTHQPSGTSPRAMSRGAPARFLGLVIAATVLASCAGSGVGSPAPSPLALPAVTAALASSGFAVVDVADNLDPRGGAWQCLPGSFRLARVSQQAPAAFARPGDRPTVDVLLFSNDAERAAAQAAIGADGQVGAQGCAAMVDWIATPHVVGARNVLLFIATDDPAALAAVKAAAARLGG